MAAEQTGLERTSLIKCRLTGEERAFIEAQADQAAVTMSEFVRRRAMGKQLISRFDDQVINELRRLGGLQKHLAVHHPAQREEFQAVLGEILALLKRLG